MLKKTALFLFMAIFFISSFAIAEEKKEEEAIKLEEVVVTATKTEKDISEAPATVSVITSKEIEEMNVHSVDEALKYIPGAYTIPRGLGGMSPASWGLMSLCVESPITQGL